MGRQVRQRLVRTPGVVMFEPPLEPGFQRRDRRVVAKIDLLVFQTPPQPFDEDVVHPAAPAVHADPYSEFQESSDPFLRGELAALVGVEDLRRDARVGHGSVQRTQAQPCLHRVGQRPAKDFARMPVHHHAEVGVAAGHRHVGDIRAPDLVGTLDGQVPQQIGILAVGLVGDACARLAPDRLMAHLAAQASDPLATGLEPVVPFQDGRQAAASQAWIDQVDLIQPPLDQAILLALRDGLIVDR